jgi:protein-disulfide isomerase
MNSMIHKKSVLGFSTVAVAVVLITLATLPSGTLALNAQAQNEDTSQQIRKYLIQAVQALDNGDNAEAIQQLQLATDQMGTFTAISDQSSDGQGNSDGDDDRSEKSEEGSGEDVDESGDTDKNDEED